MMDDGFGGDDTAENTVLRAARTGNDGLDEMRAATQHR